MADVRSTTGLPVVANFGGRYPTDVGTPVVVDRDTGKCYVLLTDNTVHRIRGDFVSVTDPPFNAVGDGVTDDTAAISSAITDCLSSGSALYFPEGTYLITSTLTSITGQFTMYGDGPFKTRLQFTPTANDVMIDVSNGVSRVEHVVFRDFAMYSTDTTYTKVALDVYDLSQCVFERLFIHGTGMASGPGAGAGWSGNGDTSIGIRTHGREATGLRDLSIFADRPIVIAANPNTVANDGEDMDHWNWENLYLVGNGNYLVSVDDGLGINEVTFEGYQAWVGGTGGFKINDTRAAPTIVSRGLNFKNVRHEQITDAAGYSFNMAFTVQIQNIGFEKVLMAAGGHGITINGFERMVCDRVTAAMAAGKNSLVTAGVTAKSVLAMRGCIWQAGSNVTLTGLTLIHAMAYRSADYAAPSDAVYAGQITDTLLNVGKVTATAANGATGLLVTGTTGDALQVNPQAGGSGAQLRIVNNAGSDFEPAAYQAETHDFRYRTGVGTTATAASMGTNGKTTFIAPTTAGASITVPHGTAPSSPVDGDIWTTTAGLFVRINGVTVGPLT